MNATSDVARLKHDARRMERKGAYQEALNTLETLRGLSPESIDIDAEIQRVKEKYRQSELIQKAILDLCLRITEIEPIYKPLVLRLKQIKREGLNDEDELLLDGVNQFLKNELPAENFITLWKTVRTRTSQSAEHPRYAILAEKLQSGEIVPFVGPEVQQLSEKPRLSSRALVQKLAEQAEYQDFEGPLSMISQYYQMTDYGRRKLLRTMQECLEPQEAVQEDNPLYTLLADIQQPLLVISASYDSRLERLLMQKQKRFVVISHLRMETGVDKILLKYAEKSEPEEPMLAEKVSERRLLENGYSIIYKVCGCFGLYGARIFGKTDQDRRVIAQQEMLQQKWELLQEKLSRFEREKILTTDVGKQFELENQIAQIKAEYEQVRQQLDAIEAGLPPGGAADQIVALDAGQSRNLDAVIISEDDYFAFAKHAETVIPSYLAGHFAQRSLLFLGHNLSEWQDRLILNAILEKKRAKSERSYAVQAQPTAYETAYWKFHGVDLYRIDLRTFVEKLQEQILE